MSNDDDALRETATYRLHTLGYDFENPTPAMEADLARLSDESAAELAAAPAIKAAVEALLVKDSLARLERQARVTANASVVADQQAFAASPAGQIIGAVSLGVLVLVVGLTFFGGGGAPSESARAERADSVRRQLAAECGGWRDTIGQTPKMDDQFALYCRCSPVGRLTSGCADKLLGDWARSVKPLMQVVAETGTTALDVPIAACEAKHTWDLPERFACYREILD